MHDTGPVQDAATVRRAFTDPEEFWSSPLYRRLCEVVAADPYLVEVAAHTRDGQVPTFALLGAVHALLLAGAGGPLADFYPSVRGDAARACADAGPPFTDFVRAHETDIVDIVSVRLVQTNQVRRAVALRLALAEIAGVVGAAPVHLLEVGCSAGLLLRHAHYGYRLGDRDAGDPHSPVQLVTQWRADTPAPDLDVLPVIASTTGIDLHPLDPADPADRRWLEALVWPEDRDKAALLHAALELAARVPVEVIAGDAVDAVPRWSQRVPAGAVRVVFHSATRMHVPADRVAAFDAAIDGVGADGPLFRVALEGDHLQVTVPGGVAQPRYAVDGHLAWAAPVTVGRQPKA